MVFPDDQRFMTEALKAAELAASLGEVPVGALVVLDGEILATAHNRRELDADPTAHAEVLAVAHHVTTVRGGWGTGDWSAVWST